MVTKKYTPFKKKQNIYECRFINVFYDKNIRFLPLQCHFCWYGKSRIKKILSIKK